MDVQEVRGEIPIEGPASAGDPESGAGRICSRRADCSRVDSVSSLTMVAPHSNACTSYPRNLKDDPVCCNESRVRNAQTHGLGYKVSCTRWGRYRSRTPGSVLRPHCENFKDSEQGWGCPPQNQWTPGSKGPGFSPLWTLPFSIWSLLHCLGPQNHTWPSVPPFFLAFLPLLTSDKVTVCVGAPQSTE